MYLKRLSAMIVDDKVEDLANYIKSGLPMRNCCVFTCLDELNKFGIENKVLAEKGAIIKLDDLITIFNTQMFDISDPNVIFTLKHYVTMLEFSIELWNARKIKIENEFGKQMINFAVKVVGEKWFEFAKTAKYKDAPFISAIEDRLIKSWMHVVINATKGPRWEANHPRKVLRHFYKIYRKSMLIDIENPDNKSTTAKIIHKELKDDLTNNIINKYLDRNLRNIFNDLWHEHLNQFLGDKNYPNNAILRILKNLSDDFFSPAIKNIIDTSRSEMKIIIEQVVEKMIRGGKVPEENKINIIDKVFEHAAVKESPTHIINLEYKNYFGKQFMHTMLGEGFIAARLGGGYSQGFIMAVIGGFFRDYLNDDPKITAIFPSSQELFADLYTICRNVQKEFNTDLCINDADEFIQEFKL